MGGFSIEQRPLYSDQELLGFFGSSFIVLKTVLGRLINGKKARVMFSILFVEGTLGAGGPKGGKYSFGTGVGGAAAVCPPRSVVDE